jgi:hypothetical protein
LAFKLREIDFELVLHRPIETTALIRQYEVSWGRSLHPEAISALSRLRLLQPGLVLSLAYHSA